MIKLKFLWMLWTGVLAPAGDHEGQPLYNITQAPNCVIEYAYRAEVYYYIKTGTFVYDETLNEDSVLARDVIYECIDEEDFYSHN